MGRALSDLRDSLNIRIHDKTGGTVESSDATDFFNRAIDRLKSKNEFPGTKQRAEFDVFAGIYEYVIPSGYKSPISFRTSSNAYIDFHKRTAKGFWQDLSFNSDDLYADDNYNDTKLLLIRRSTNKSSAILHNCNDLTDNGTWAADTADSDAINISEDTIEYIEGSGSINFDLDVSQSANNYAAIAVTGMTAVDLDDHENVSTIFIDAYLADTTYLSSITFRWGNDSSNYWSQTVTAQASGIAFKDGWNTLGFAWNGATETGTGDPSEIDYLYYRLTYSSSQTDDTDFRIDNIRSVVPERIAIDYYSSNFVKDTDGDFQSTFSADDDVSVLEEHEDVMLLYFALEEAFDFLRLHEESTKAREKAEGLYAEISSDKPNEKEKPSDHYYYT